ncbi:MAG: PKD domain-containing protein [Bacteroidota bacterium]|nr:PKD domain-containing protein [Bacteroidota bacterium]
MKQKILLTLILSFSLVPLHIVAQECIVEIIRPASDTTICFGDSVYLKSEGACNIFLNGGFENGLGPGWSSSYPDPIFNENGCNDEYFPLGPGPNGFYSWFGPTGQMVKPRHITTDTFDISIGGDCNLKFWMRYGRAEHAGNSDCEDPNNPDNGLHLQYSTDFGATWFDFPGVNQYPTGQNKAYTPFYTLNAGSGGYWQPTQENPVGGFHVPERYDTSAVYWWHQYSCSIPPVAITTQTMFRFFQDFHQAAKTDTWGIDEVLLWCSNNQDVFWSHGPTVFNPEEPVSPAVTTDYIVTVYDSLGNFATDTVRITVIPIPDPDLGPDTTICDDGVNIAYFDAGPGFEHYLWNTGDTTQVITPNVTGWYSVTATNYNCSGEDSVYLQMIPQVYGNAGSDEVTCEETPFDLSTAAVPPTASDYSSILWYGGSGTFDDPNIVTPVYTPAPGETGLVILTMVAYGFSPCGNDTSQMTLNVFANAIADAGSDEGICKDQPFDFATSTIVPNAANYDTLYWIGGAGSFVDPNAMVPVYIPAPGELGQVTLTMITSGLISNCDSIDEMILTIHPDFLTAIDTTICFLDAVFAQGNWQFTSGVYYDTLQTVNTCDSVIQTNLTVRPEIDYDFVADPESVCLGETMYFTQSGSSTITSFLWDFGDGQTSTLFNPPHLYTSIGNYTVTLSYTDDNGCSDEKTHSVEATLSAEVDFTANPNPSCINDLIYFEGYSNYNIVQWQWDFGDGQNGTGQNVTHSYNTPGTYVVTVSGVTSNGCGDSTSNNVYIPPSPVADFTYYVVYCDSIQFTDLSYHPIGYNLVEWQWDFGDGGSSVLQHPHHVYDSSGVFLVTLTVTSDSAGLLCTNTITKPVNVPGLPTVYFTWDRNPTCFGSPTSFFGTSGANIASWYWSFGDGNTATGQEPVHLFTSIDMFDVVLTVTDANGCADSIIHSVKVVDIPDIDFTVSPNPTCRDNLTSFDGISAANISDWTWDFGDGSTGVGQYTSHSYIQTGTFDVVITVSDSGGCTNYISHPVKVNNPPTADFSFNETTCSNDTVYFTDYSSTPNGSILQWEWDLGDGTVITIQYPDDPDITYVYPMGGSYTVTLTVLDSDGCSHSFSRVIEIESSPIADFNNPPACDGSAVEFTDLSSINGGSPIITWYWEFGDPTSGNNTSTQPNPAHIFSSNGIYYVTLVVNNIVNCSDTIVKIVEVNGLPEVDFVISSDTTCINEEVEFTSLSPDALTYWWDFGDGGSSVQMDPVHVYQTIPGTYLVSLTVIDYNGCENTVSHIIIVDPPPFADFSNSTLSCTGIPILFTDESNVSSGYLTQWHWYFGDGTDTVVYYPDDPNVYHSYDTAGNYTASLIVNSSFGCSDSIGRDIIVTQGPVSLFDYSDNSCEGANIEFYDLSYAFGGTITFWQWDFDDPSSGANNTSNLQNPTHMFGSAGTYNVTLQATMNGGCYGISSQEVTIDPEPTAYFYTDPPSSCFMDLTYFYIDPDSTNIAEVASYLWDFDDPASGASGTSNLQNPTHLFSAPGIYNVSLTITDIYNCQGTSIQQVNVGEKPIAEYTYEMPCISDSTQFIDISTGGGAMVSGWLWDFNDPSTAPNNTSNLQNPRHKFSAVGTYNVTLIVTDVNGCTDIIDKIIQINDSPTSAFSFNTLCDPPGSVSFNDLSWPGTGNQPIVDWLWEFEPGIYSQQVNPQHIYNYTDSCYQVNLTVTDQQGCQHTSTREVCINDPLEISIASGDVCLGQRAHFNAIYQPSNDTVVQWTWNFGDGTPLLHTSKDTISHKYAQTGTYFVTVVAINTSYCESEAIREIEVKTGPEPDFAATTAKCNDPTLFTDLSVSPGSIVTSWEWDFDDGNFSSLQNPEHVYGPMDRTYLVTLTISNAEGCIGSIQKEVIKSICVQASFEPDNGIHCNDQNVCFTDESFVYSDEYPLTRWEWNFGDGTTQIHTTYQESICHEYNDNGTYEVTLIVSALVNGIAHYDTTSRDVYLLASPTSDFISSSPCINSGTQFTDMTQGHGAIITSWEWDFGDYTSFNDVSTLQHPTYNYANPGNYEVKLVTTNNYNCSDTLYREIEIFTRPIVDFSYELSCAGKTTTFMDETVAGQAPFYQWNWNFGDSQGNLNTSNLQNPKFIYEQQGNYIVQLKVRDYNMCEDTLSKVIEVYPTPESNFYIVSNYDGIYGQVLCENLSYGAQLYAWDFGNGKTSERENPKVFYEENGIYLVQLISTNEYQCVDTAYVQHEVIRQGLYVPNAFVPESHISELQTFKPIGLDLRAYKIEIFNRWGAVVWSSMKLDGNGSPAEGWDGTYKGSPLPIGDYMWSIKAQLKTGKIWQGSDVGDGNTKTYGTVTLIR